MAGRARKAGRRKSSTIIWLIKAVVMALEIHINKPAAQAAGADSSG